ncbi:MAG: ATP-dependent DNA ligase [Micrococcales bacterium]|nr:ATP-dependent DNA ligase [Micrococcales bacterium]
MAAGASEKTVVSVEGHRLTLTNLDKVLFPEAGTTKRDVLEYYAAVAEWMLPHIAERPATRKRWVNGVGTATKPGSMFFQKNLDPASTPSWVPRRTLEHSDHANDYPLVNDLATLTWLAQTATLEIHVPQWRFGRGGARHDPDRLVLDLDPGEGAGLPECVEVAKLARELLRGVGLDALPATSGSKGIHLYCGLDERRSSRQISDFAHELARALEADHPDLVVSDMKKTLRQGRVLVDWSQNNGNKTTIAPYSLRGRLRPTVAAPRTWRELAAKDLRQLEYPEVLQRLRRRGDPLGGLVAGRPGAPLGAYRAKRDSAKTPEPFGDERHRAAGRSGEPVFVVQEHHASRLHWDFRLEHEGVLVSWALPKGVPESPGRNHLAVQTEDHPMDYAGFAGDIPAGEYGAGHVEIWDEGTYSLEKWRDDEVIVTLHGTRGDHRYALIRTGSGSGGGTAKAQWLIHLMKEQQPDASASPSSRDGRAHSRAASGSRTSGPPARAAVAPRTAAPRAAAARAPLGATYAPELATLGTLADFPAAERDAWAYEMKWDGFRAVASARGGEVRVTSRSGKDMTATFPELAALTGAVEADAVVDGEIVALDRAGRPSFGRLQQRAGLTTPADVERAARAVPVAYFVFDLLEHDGIDLTREPYTVRRAELVRAVRAGGPIQVPADAGDDLDDALATSRELGLEGVMAKRRDSRYRVGKRSRDWIKLKHHLAQEVVVLGWRPGAGRRSGTIGSLLLGIPGPDGIRYVGRVGTGFRERDLEEMQERFPPLAQDGSPAIQVPRADARDARWIRPELVGEVEYAERTGDGRLRHASWRGWRPDKNPAEVRDESPDP